MEAREIVDAAVRAGLLRLVGGGYYMTRRGNCEFEKLYGKTDFDDTEFGHAVLRMCDLTLRVETSKN